MCFHTPKNESQFYNPAKRRVREAAKEWDVELSDIEETTSSAGTIYRFTDSQPTLIQLPRA